MIIERQGAKPALLTTKGFGDLLEIGRQVRPSLYNLQEDKPEPLVPRSLRKEVDERILADGSELKEVSPNQVKEILLKLKKENVASVAVCFLFSYLNHSHEEIVAGCVLFHILHHHP